MKNFLQKLWTMMKSNLAMKIVALLFAFVIWSYVMAGTNPTRSKTVDDVPLTITNSAELQSKGLIITDKDTAFPDTVSITVDAGVDSHKNITSDTLKATVNLADINETGKVEVRITGSSTVSDAEIKSVSPSSLTVSVDDLVSRDVPVLATLEGDAREDYYVSAPKLSSDFVTVRGAKSVIERISKAVCNINIEELTSDVRESYPLTLYDDNGDVVSSDLVSGNLPSIIVDISVLPKKSVTVDKQSVLDAITNVKDGYVVTGVVIDPSSIYIAGQQSVLDQIDSVRVQSINAEQADKSIVLDAQIQPLDNLSYQSATSVSVLVQISEKQAEKTFRSLKILTTGLADGYTAKIVSGRTTDVKVSGGRSVIYSLTADDVAPYIDLTGKTVGTFTCDVTVPGLENVDYTNKSLSVTQATVVISKAR